MTARNHFTLTYLLCAASLSASEIYAPGPEEGNLANSIPFAYENIWPDLSEAGRYQQRYPASMLAEPINITEIDFRLDSVFGAAFDLFIPDIEISMWTLNADLGSDLDANVGSDRQVVYRRGSLHLYGSRPGSFVPIYLTDPFAYYALPGENLVTEFHIYELSIIPETDWDTRIAQPALDASWHGGLQRAFAKGPGAENWTTSEAWYVDDVGLVTRFVGEAPVSGGIGGVPTPEPSSFLLVAATLAIWLPLRNRLNW